MKKFNLILFCLLFIIAISHANDWDSINDRTLYIGTTDKPINITWDSNNSNYFNVQVWIPYKSNSSTLNTGALVKYDIYDNQELKYTKLIDQSLEKYSNKWVTITKFALPISSGNLKLVMTVNDQTNYAVADAVRLTYSPCEENSLGIIVLVGSNNTHHTGVWLDVDSNYTNFYSVISPKMSIGESTYVWEFFNIMPPNYDISYDLYLKHFPSGAIYAFSNTTMCGIPVNIPKTGHYIFYIRTLRSSITTELDNKNRNDLITLINTKNSRWACSKFYVDNGFGSTVTELRSKMLNAGSCSDWVNSAISTTSVVNCNHQAWWVYGYPAPPGQIDFSNE